MTSFLIFLEVNMGKYFFMGQIKSMRFFITLLILSILFFRVEEKTIAQTNCSQFKEIFEISTNKQNGYAEVILINKAYSIDSFYYSFSDQRGKPLNKDARLNYIYRLDPGSYYCTIYHKSGCMIKLFFEI